MAYSLEDRALALAAILQPIEQVQSIARKGEFNDAILQTSVHSILNTQPESVGALYGGAASLTRGLRLLIQQFEKKTEATSKELLHYFVAINQLQKKMMKKPELLSALSEGIVEVNRKQQHFSTDHVNVIARLADIYTSTVSHLSPRIMVQGEQIYLSNTTHINRVRTLLLAAIRAAVLWHQCGGGHLKLLLERKKLIAVARHLLNQGL